MEGVVVPLTSFVQIDAHGKLLESIRALLPVVRLAGKLGDHRVGSAVY